MAESAPIDLESAGLALWTTQARDGTGLACWDVDKGAYVWHELPEWAEKMAKEDPARPKLGEPIHPELDLIPANTAAYQEMFND